MMERPGQQNTTLNTGENKPNNMSFKNAISWFEIPATDLDRATKFYEAIFGFKLIVMDLPNIKMRMFPIEDMMGVGGAVVDSGGFHKPSSTDGPLIYLNGNPDVQQVLDKVEAAGGKIVVPKTEISPEYGFMGVFVDTEGNRIGLHSIPQQ
jgi:uncharacterized protein